MRVCISGGGIGGLATALALHSKQCIPNLYITILERDARPNAFVGRGAGINLQPHALKSLDEIGLMEEVIASGWAPLKQQYFTKSGHSIAVSPRGLAADSSFYPQISIHRAKLHRILERAVQERLGYETIRRGIQGISYSQNANGVLLHCESTSTSGSSGSSSSTTTTTPDDDERSFETVDIHSDVLIGADGIHSSLRKTMLQNFGMEKEALSGPIQSGISIYRGTSVSDKVLDGQTIVLAGHSRAKLVCYPLEPPNLVTNHDADGSICQKQLLNFVVEIAEDKPASPSEMQDLSNYVAAKLEDLNGGFELPFLDHRSLLQNADSIRAFPMADRDPLDTWCDSRVALMGDAAHPMYPVGSNGASLALLDAVEIASSFDRTFKGNNNKAASKIDHHDICQSLEDYQSRRRPAAVSAQLACRQMLPEQVMDQVHNETLRRKGPTPVSNHHEENLLQALGKCQIGHSDDETNPNKKPSLRTPVAFANAEQATNFSPIERVLLTANGTLQRIISAIANTEVTVKPLMTSVRSSAFMDREVTLHLGSSLNDVGPCVAKCTTTVLPHDETVKEKMLSQKIGIAQLLSELRQEGKGEPTFQLVAAGKLEDPNMLTRQYKLTVKDQVTFLIHEEIYIDTLLKPSSTSQPRPGQRNQKNLYEPAGAPDHEEGNHSVPLTNFEY